jgi:nitric oxide dioxygenase
VVEHREETADVVSFLLRPADGRPAPAARAGQYVSVRMRMPDGVHQLRRYSLSSDPGGDLRRITVHQLTLSAPFGDVVLDEAGTPLVLVSAGIGCTPMVGMLARLAATGSTRPVLVLHADGSPDDHALRAETRELTARLPQAEAVFWYEGPGAAEPGARTGLMDLDGVALPADATVYLCGPVPFMRAVRTRLPGRGIPPHRIHYEVFGPDLWLPDADGVFPAALALLVACDGPSPHVLSSSP